MDKRSTHKLKSYEAAAKIYYRQIASGLGLRIKEAQVMNYYRIFYPLTYKKLYPGLPLNIDAMNLFIEKKFDWIDPLKDK